MKLKLFEGRTPSQPPRKTYPLARGVVPDRSDASALKIVPRVGLWGTILAGGGHCRVGCACVICSAYRVVRLILGKVGIAGKLFLRRVAFFYFGMHDL